MKIKSKVEIKKNSYLSIEELHRNSYRHKLSTKSQKKTLQDLKISLPNRTLLRMIPHLLDYLLTILTIMILSGNGDLELLKDSRDLE